MTIIPKDCIVPRIPWQLPPFSLFHFCHHFESHWEVGSWTSESGTGTEGLWVLVTNSPHFTEVRAGEKHILSVRNLMKTCMKLKRTKVISYPGCQTSWGRCSFSKFLIGMDSSLLTEKSMPITTKMWLRDELSLLIADTVRGISQQRWTPKKTTVWLVQLVTRWTHILEVGRFNPCQGSWVRLSTKTLLPWVTPWWGVGVTWLTSTRVVPN